LLREPTLPLIPGYDVEAELGRGGMGVVYKAVQTELQRPVALKMILHSRLASPDALGRFHREALAVAKLHHPNIVQIYEIGDYQGQPFFSLEFVNGISLAEYLRGQPQEPRAAAQLVQTLARAMQYAHELGIVHRDLKPANILLAVGSGPLPVASKDTPSAILTAAQAKITDFGLAKDLSMEDRTVSGAVLGTPSYMAPEQAMGRLQEIGPACDVYSLGAILYEMLTGRPPFKGASMFDTLEQVRSSDTVPPRKLAPKTPGDLEIICLKCLEKRAERRYASAGAMAEDLRRFLDGQPIQARPAVWWEKAGKWARRHPAVASLSLSLAVLLLVAFTVVTWMWRDTAEKNAQLQQTQAALVQERNAALKARDEAEEERRKTQTWLGFLREALTAARPTRFGPQVTLIKAIEIAAHRLVDNDKLAIGTRIEFNSVLGKTFWELGQFTKAEPYLRKALELCRQQYGEEHPETYFAANNLGTLLMEVNKEAEAAVCLRHALAGYRRLYGEKHPDTVLVRSNYGTLLHALNRWVEAEVILREVWQDCVARSGVDSLDALEALHNYAHALQSLGRYQEAEPLARRSMEGLKKHKGLGYPTTIAAMNNLAIILHRAGRGREAEPLYREVLVRLVPMMGQDHPYLRIVLSSLAKLKLEQRELTAALAETEQTLASFARKPEQLIPFLPLALMQRMVIFSLLFNSKPDHSPPSAYPPPP
jgi:tetratricopeptide (TPR) repeat protein/tRNA A-37 threonylcarbamoyl transferase component Bud32